MATFKIADQSNGETIEFRIRIDNDGDCIVEFRRFHMPDWWTLMFIDHEDFTLWRCGSPNWPATDKDGKITMAGE